MPLACARGAKQLDHVGDERREIERDRFEIEPAGFDFRKIQNFLDQREQRLARGFHRAGISLLFGGKSRFQKKIGHAQDAVQGRAHFVTDHGEKARFRAARGFGFFAGDRKRPLGGDAGGYVPAHALNFDDPSRLVANRDFFPGDPARACFGRDLLIERARAVGMRDTGALRAHFERNRMADDLVERLSHEGAKHLARIGDAPRLVLAHDELALRIGELGGADKRFLERPNSIVALLQQRFELRQPLRVRVRAAVA